MLSNFEQFKTSVSRFEIKLLLALDTLENVRHLGSLMIMVEVPCSMFAQLQGYDQWTRLLMKNLAGKIFNYSFPSVEHRMLISVAERIDYPRNNFHNNYNSKYCDT